MKKYICDRCGEIITGIMIYQLKRADHTKIDLCDSCDDALDEFLEGKEE